MAQIIDNREDEVLLEDGEAFQSFEDSEEQPSQVEEPQSELPDKYKDKDIKDIIAMHQNAEQLLGKQGQEVGELRKVVDDFIQSQTVKQEQAPVNDDFDELDFFDNPKEAVAKLVANHPSVKQSNEMAAKLKQETILAQLNSRHPDWQTVITDASFGEWIGKSKIRTQLLAQADKNYDYDAADELLTLWKERKEAVNTTVNSEKAARKQQVKSASTGTASGSAERPSRKIYRRQDIIELMRTDPERYTALAPEIRQAYAEKRVK